MARWPGCKHLCRQSTLHGVLAVADSQVLGDITEKSHSSHFARWEKILLEITLLLLLSALQADVEGICWTQTGATHLSLQVVTV